MVPCMSEYILLKTSNVRLWRPVITLPSTLMHPQTCFKISFCFIQCTAAVHSIKAFTSLIARWLTPIHWKPRIPPAERSLYFLKRENKKRISRLTPLSAKNPWQSFSKCISHLFHSICLDDWMRWQIPKLWLPEVFFKMFSPSLLNSIIQHGSILLYTQLLPVVVGVHTSTYLFMTLKLLC